MLAGVLTNITVCYLPLSSHSTKWKNVLRAADPGGNITAAFWHATFPSSCTFRLRSHASSAKLDRAGGLGANPGRLQSERSLGQHLHSHRVQSWPVEGLVRKRKT
ncbi:hypothetical protein OS493_010382 [Desmophyllum pertusum]|uniref:Uncharacterized protein n=1 Tax=Desmophyllum pertusum TaxID=174260 RepID=A0A9X0DC91_9CNID|nr:hypothetical protein OS493_010382 [Desmophyllum pertusum]